MILIAEKGCATLVPAARSAVGDKSAPPILHRQN